MIHVLAKLSPHCIQNFSILFPQNSNEQWERRGVESNRGGKKGDLRIKPKHSSLSSQTSKGNSRNYGDFSEESHEIDVILPRGPRLFVTRAATSLTKEGRSKVQMKRYLNCHTYTYLVYVSPKLLAPVSAFAFARWSSRITYSYRQANQWFSPCVARVFSDKLEYLYISRVLMREFIIITLPIVAFFDQQITKN